MTLTNGGVQYSTNRRETSIFEKNNLFFLKTESLRVIKTQEFYLIKWRPMASIQKDSTVLHTTIIFYKEDEYVILRVYRQAEIMASKKGNTLVSLP